MKNTQKIGLVLGPIVFLLLLLFFKPEGLSPEGRAVLAAPPLCRPAGRAPKEWLRARGTGNCR